MHISDRCKTTSVQVLSSQVMEIFAGHPDIAAGYRGQVRGVWSAASRVGNRLAGPYCGGLAPWQIACTERYFDHTVTLSASIGDLAGLTRLNVSHFSRAFKVGFQCSPYRYLMKRRIERA